jgi:Family of unknown function (DUF6941)
MKATVVLADMGQNDASGKLNLLGAGWSITQISPIGLTPDSAVAVFMEVDWDKVGREIDVLIELVDDDDEPVVLTMPDGNAQPVKMRQAVIANPTPGAPSGSPTMVTLLVGIQGGLPLSPGRWYKWRVSLDGKHLEDWAARFYVQRQPTTPTFGGG